MKRWAMINRETNVVENVCNWDGSSRWNPPENYLMVQTDIANFGDTYDEKSQTFIRKGDPEIIQEDVGIEGAK